MKIVAGLTAFRRVLDEVRAGGASVGFVPTMGALHAGHRSLVRQARAGHEHVAVSIFVNPLQFDRPEDLARYPRTLDADLAACEEEGVSTVFVPEAADMFPPDAVTTVSVPGLTERFEGASRPGHFDGVATVVAKLLALAGPATAYFGEKDFQQLLVVRRMVKDLSLPAEIVGCPTVRERDGLARSSRNARLSAPERLAAVVLWHALEAGHDAVAGGEEDAGRVEAVMADVVSREPLARLDYAAAVDASDLSVPRQLSDATAVRLLIAAAVGPVRLIDNAPAPAPATVAPGAETGHNRASRVPAPGR